MADRVYNVLFLCTGNSARKTAAFRNAFQMLERRIALFTSLPIASLDRLALGNKIREIGKS